MAEGWRPPACSDPDDAWRGPPPTRLDRLFLQGSLAAYDHNGYHNFRAPLRRMLDKETQTVIHLERCKDARPDREKEVGQLRPGTRFRLDTYEGRWVYGHLVERSGLRAIVRLDGERQTTWPLQTTVEWVNASLTGSTADSEAEDGTMTTSKGTGIAVSTVEESKQRSIQAKWNFQQGQLSKAQGAGDETAIDRAETKLAEIVAEAEKFGVLLTEADVPEPTPAPAKSGKVVTMGKGKVEVAKSAPGKGEALKAANATRLANLATKKAADKAAKPKAAPKEKKLAATHNCICGCGTETGGKFAPGHDARAKGLLLKVERGDLKVADLHPELARWVKFAGKAASAGKDASDYRIVLAPIKFPGRDDIAMTEVTF